MISRLEHAEEFLVQGWALHEEAPSVTVALDVFIDQQLIARLPAHTFRSDLLAAGYGDGHHAFFFNPFDYLSSASNLIEVREASSAALLDDGSRRISSELCANRDAYRRAHAHSQVRWSEPDSNTGSAEGENNFVRILLSAVHLHPSLRILEFGAGRGFIIHELLNRKQPFYSYLGIDLSRDLVNRLHNRFASPQVSFLTGDAARYPFTGGFELVIASSLFDGLFPSFLPAARNISRVLAPSGLLAFDLVVEDNRNSISRATWHGDSYVRLYSEAELRRLLAEAGLELLQAQIYSKAENEHRAFVTAFKPHRRPENRILVNK